MQVQTSLLNQMIKNVADPQLRETYGNIISGNYPFKVYCLNPQINPETKKPYHAAKCVIGYMTANKQVVDQQIIDKKLQRPVAGIETSRDRFDGRKGFKCYCGNYSIVAAEEKGIIGASVAPSAPTKEDMNHIFSNLQKSGKGQLVFNNGYAEYDGFGIEEIRA